MIFILWLISTIFGTMGFGLVASALSAEVGMGLTREEQKYNLVKGSFSLVVSFVIFYITVIS
jgi:hypothetical protein